jgi:two-component system, OmpR family, heavy metal sensor histidine kinase CusS
MFKRSVSARLALMFALASVLIVSAYGLLLRGSLHDSLQKQMHNELRFRHSLMEPWIQSHNKLADWQVLANKFRDLALAEGGRVQYWILSADPRFNVGGAPPSGVNWAALNNGFSKVPGATEGSCSLFLMITVIPASGERPELRYAVSIDSTPYIGTFNEFTRTLVLITAVGVLLVALFGFIIARVGMRPVSKLSEQAHRLAPGNHGQRLETAVLPDELQKLAVAFNGVLERQEVAWCQLESFNADVAHELRTPLTNLTGQTQLALSRQRNIEEMEEFLESNLEEMERMTSIVNDMLFLSHAQAGEHAQQLTLVSLREETYKTAEYVEPSFAEKNLSIEVEGDLNACIDRRLFHRALANLLENGARHSSSGGTVRVVIREEDQYASVAVTNTGEPIAPEHLSRLFERFYRVDSARTRSDTHHGLGLSIVRAVALMHQGDVFASSKNGINTFGITFAKKSEPVSATRRHPEPLPDAHTA